MTFQESSDFDCATFAKNWNWRIGKNRIGNRGNARAFLLVTFINLINSEWGQPKGDKVKHPL